MGFAVVLLFTIFSFVIVITKMTMDFKKSEWQVKQGDTDRGLLASELKSIIRDAVEEATLPLVERIDTLEATLDKTLTPKLTGRDTHLLSEAPSVENTAAENGDIPQ